MGIIADDYVVSFFFFYGKSKIRFARIPFRVNGLNSTSTFRDARERIIWRAYPR